MVFLELFRENMKALAHVLWRSDGKQLLGV